VHNSHKLLSDASLIAFLSCRPPLVSFECKFNRKLTDRAVEALGFYCPTLETIDLNLSLSSFGGLVELVPKCKFLTSVKYSFGVGNNFDAQAQTELVLSLSDGAIGIILLAGPSSEIIDLTLVV
jgi:hypothetical protein